MSTGKLFRELAIFFFLSGFCFFQDNSAFQDKHHLGYTFIIAGIVFGICFLFVLKELITGSKQ